MSTPVEALERDVVLTMNEVASILKLTHTRGARKGQADARRARQLIEDRKLRLVDPDAPVYYWRVSTAEVRRYLNGGAA